MSAWPPKRRRSGLFLTAASCQQPTFEYLRDSGRPHKWGVRLLTSVGLVARMGLVHFFYLLQDLTQVVGFGVLHRRIRDVAFQLLEPQLLAQRHYGKSVVHEGCARSGQ